MFHISHLAVSTEFLQNFMTHSCMSFDLTLLYQNAKFYVNVGVNQKLNLVKRFDFCGTLAEHSDVPRISVYRWRNYDISHIFMFTSIKTKVHLLKCN